MGVPGKTTSPYQSDEQSGRCPSKFLQVFSSSDYFSLVWVQVESDTLDPDVGIVTYL